MTASDLRRAAFLDRDGTINVEVDYLSAPEQLELIPGAAHAIGRLNDAGWFVVVITNQSGVARGKLTEQTLADIHARLDAMLAEHGAHIDAYYHCPHHPEHGEAPYRASCDCRKPAPGMLLRAAREHDLDLTRSWTVGDSLRDLDAGAAAGTRGILVATGKPQQLAEESASRFGTADLRAAVEAMLDASDA